MKKYKNANQVYGHYVPCTHLAILVAFSEQCGIEIKPLLQKQGLNFESINLPGANMPAKQYSQLLLSVDTLTNEDGFWFCFSKQLGFPAFDALGQVMLSCDTLRQSIHMLAKYYQLLSCGSELVCIENENSLEIQIYRQSSIESRASLIRSELLTSVIFRGILIVLADQGEKLRFEFDYKKPKYASLYYKYLNRNCAFSTAQSKIIIPAEYLRRPSLHPNPVMLKILIKQCDQSLYQLSSYKTISSQVRTVVSSIPGQYPTAESVAQKIGLSTRTLSRRLKKQGTTFQILMNEVKTQRAINYLQTTEMSIEEVATMVGYSNSANFRRAFISWTGTLPSKYRRLLSLE